MTERVRGAQTVVLVVGSAVVVGSVVSDRVVAGDVVLVDDGGTEVDVLVASSDVVVVDGSAVVVPSELFAPEHAVARATRSSTPALAVAVCR